MLLYTSARRALFDSDTLDPAEDERDHNGDAKNAQHAGEEHVVIPNRHSADEDAWFCHLSPIRVMDKRAARRGRVVLEVECMAEGCGAAVVAMHALTGGWGKGQG
jgi:hypothetical protein